MCEVRNTDGKLVCRIDKKTGLVEIKIKDCVTSIKFNSEGKIKIINTKIRIF